MEDGSISHDDKTMVSEHAEDMECTICMETISSATVLPCRCRLSYCQSCWNRALANSFRQSGQARCPSCRTPVRVDFDAEKHCLLFRPETEDMSTTTQQEIMQSIRRDFMLAVEEGQYIASDAAFRRFAEQHSAWDTVVRIDRLRQESLERIRVQCSPAQKTILQRYGEANRSILDIHDNGRMKLMEVPNAELQDLIRTINLDLQDCDVKSDIVDRLLESTSSERMSATWASKRCPPPKCVCSSALIRFNGRERFIVLLKGRNPDISDEDAQDLADNNADYTCCSCDICGNNILSSRDSFVWTCENRYGTILHARSNDICDSCFVKYTSKEYKSLNECMTRDGI